MVEWRIYYGDGSTFDNTQGEPHEAPVHNLVCIVANGEQRYLLLRWDWYYYKNNEWWGCDIHGLLDQFMHYAPDIKGVIQGRTIDTDKYQEIVQIAQNDPDFPESTQAKRAEQIYGDGEKK